MAITLRKMKARLPPERSKKIERRADEIENQIKGLQALRVARASTQVELADRLHISQASVAKLEKRADILLSTLRQYIEALGGRLDLVVRFKDDHEPLLITGLAEENEAPGIERDRRKKPARSAGSATKPVEEDCAC